jgi:hypothetical protein
VRDGLRLAQDGAEPEGLADGRRLEVQVLLLHVARLALEGHIALPAVNEHLAGDHTHSDPGGKDIE